MKVLSKIENNEDAITKKYVDDKAGVTAVDPTSGAVTTDFFIPTKTSDLTNDSGFITSAALAGKQDTLVSGTNIKTINNQSLLGSGNIDVSGGGGTPTDVRINNTSITSNSIANIVTNTAYNSSSNKIATMTDVNTKLSSTSLAPVYSTSKTYGENSLVTYNNQLYINTGGTTSGTWDSSKWTARTIADLFGDISYIGELSGDVPASLSYFAEMLQNERAEYATYASIAEDYSAYNTYAIGDYVMYGYEYSNPYSRTPAQLYKCTTAITTPEAWNSSHWTVTNILEIMEDKIDAVLEASY